MLIATGPEGWQKLTSARQWHYFRRGVSLCGRWLTYARQFEQGLDESPYNCKTCQRVLQRERAG